MWVVSLLEGVNGVTLAQAALTGRLRRPDGARHRRADHVRLTSRAAPAARRRVRRSRASQGPAQTASSGLCRPPSASSPLRPDPPDSPARDVAPHGHWPPASPLLLGAGAAQAQSSGKLVGNTGQSDDGASNTQTGWFHTDMAQSFTTGSHADGYKLTSVVLQAQRGSATAPTLTVTIRSNSSGSPATASLGTLTKPTTLAGGNNTFSTSAAGIDLAASTTYFVVIDSYGFQFGGYRRGGGVEHWRQFPPSARPGELRRMVDTLGSAPIGRQRLREPSRFRCRSSRINDLSGSVGSIDSPVTRISRHRFAIRFWVRSHSRVNFMCPITCS